MRVKFGLKIPIRLGKMSENLREAIFWTHTVLEQLVTTYLHLLFFFNSKQKNMMWWTGNKQGVVNFTFSAQRIHLSTKMLA